MTQINPRVDLRHLRNLRLIILLLRVTLPIPVLTAAAKLPSF